MATPAEILERARLRIEEERRAEERAKEWARSALGLDLDALERLRAPFFHLFL